MSHYERALIAYYETQGADKEQIQHIFHTQTKWK